MTPPMQVRKRLPILETLHTDILFVVNVPVLSEQMTLVQPSVSTDNRLLTIAFFLAIRLVPNIIRYNIIRLTLSLSLFLIPNARHVVMTAGRPSGIAATAKATAILK